MDILATITPQEYRTLKARMSTEGTWHGGNGTPAEEDRSNARAEEILTETRTR